MSDVFFAEMDIPKPTHALDIHSISHGAMTGRMIEKVEELLMAEKPDAVLVYGDTNSTLAGALAACKLHIPVAHAEAGLRSFNMAMPEEINRILTDRVSQTLFCPTQTAVNNLVKEGFQHFNCRILQVGDVMYDAFLFYQQKAKSTSTVLQSLQLEKKPFLLTTIHRAENTDNPEVLENIIGALNRLSHDHPVVWPVHPRTRQRLHAYSLDARVTLIEPVGYFDMIQLLAGCRLVLTDSGGLQKEACFSGKFCVTLREQTEWTELVDHGVNVVAGTAAENVVKQVHRLLNESFPAATHLYGDGKAAEKIAEVFR
jgi:UDP-GlcNAc3NAcA epimerase